MGTGRRTVRLLLALALIGVPAVVLRGLCVGHACESAAEPSSNTPFCRLPESLRRPLMAGFRDERSPDVFMVSPVPGSVESPQGIWPGSEDPDRGVVVFSGPGAPDELPAGMGFDQVAPTIARIIGLKRAHPEVRSGRAVDVDPRAERPRLVLQVGLKGAGSSEGLPPSIASLADKGAVVEARYGSKPIDPAALLTTIGTGGLPRQHGITGTFLRDADGTFGRAWSREGNFDTISVIATLADDLDEADHQRAGIGMVAHDVSDRGLIGGGWYVGADRDPFVIEPSPRRAARRASTLLREMELPGMLGLTMDVTSSTGAADAALNEVLTTAREISGDSVLVVVAGMDASPAPAVTQDDLLAGLGDDARLIEGTTAGGLFLDQDRLAAEKVSEDVIVKKLEDVRLPHRAGRAERFADVFSGISLAFGSYC